MRVFYNTTFRGVWPTGVCAVVVASDRNFAAKRLEIELKQSGMVQHIDKDSMIEIDLNDPKAHVLINGDY